jgi:hypothetical protein
MEKMDGRIVHVGGRPYRAVEDDRGRLRFAKDPDHFLVKRMTPIFGGNGTADPNTMAVEYHQGRFSLRDYAEMNIAMGYSVGGFEELSTFFELEISCGDPALDRPGRHFGPQDDTTGTKD